MIQNAYHSTDKIKIARSYILLILEETLTIFIFGLIISFINRRISKRNYTYGKLIATDRKAAEEFLESHTVEGYNTLKIVYKFIKSKRVSLPAIDLVYKVAVVGADPHVLVEYLMNIK